MPGFWLRLIISAVGLWIASAIVGGVHLEGVGTLILAALLLGFANAVVRPVVIFLTLPITLVTLGLFLLVINAGMLALVATVLPHFTIDGFFPAIGAAIIVSLVSWIASWTIGPRGHVEIMVMRNEPRAPL